MVYMCFIKGYIVPISWQKLQQKVIISNIVGDHKMHLMRACLSGRVRRFVMFSNLASRIILHFTL